MLKFDSETTTHKFEQIRDEIIRNIENGYFKSNSPLPSISNLGINYGFSRVTVDRAYKHLKTKGYITYLVGKGYIVAENKEIIKILLIFNKLSYYKKNTYYGLLEALEGKAKVDLQVHHYDIKILDEIIDNNLNRYDYFVVMPHFNYETSEKEYNKVLNKIPSNKLLLLDKSIPDQKNVLGSVYQDFKDDIFSTLISVTTLFKKYKKLILILPSYSNHPLEIIEGAKMFCEKFNIEFSVIEGADDEEIISQTAYIIIEEAELAEIIKKIRNSKYKLGKDVGLISFNETVLKELLEITVITTDFDIMGKSLGQMIINQNFAHIKNPFTIIRRKSF
jgi:DNA-binding transcriptional regulator YhcF (GntR family)